MCVICLIEHRHCGDHVDSFSLLPVKSPDEERRSFFCETKRFCFGHMKMAVYRKVMRHHLPCSSIFLIVM